MVVEWCLSRKSKKYLNFLARALEGCGGGCGGRRRRLLPSSRLNFLFSLPPTRASGFLFFSTFFSYTLLCIFVAKVHKKFAMGNKKGGAHCQTVRIFIHHY